MLGAATRPSPPTICRSSLPSTTIAPLAFFLLVTSRTPPLPYFLPTRICDGPAALVRICDERVTLSSLSSFPPRQHGPDELIVLHELVRHEMGPWVHAWAVGAARGRAQHGGGVVSGLARHEVGRS